MAEVGMWIAGMALMFSHMNLVMAKYQTTKLYEGPKWPAVMRDYDLAAFWATILLWPVAVVIMCAMTLMGADEAEWYGKAK